MISREVLVDLWWELFSWCWMSGRFLSVWKSSIVVLVSKKRSKVTCRTDEFQSISLVLVAYKAMCKLKTVYKKACEGGGRKTVTS